MSQFILKINLGNEAMQIGYDIAPILKSIAKYLLSDFTIDYSRKQCNFPVVDINGNTVGSWMVK